MPKKIDPTRYDTDKPGLTAYFENYERLFGPIAEEKIALLELGVKRGGSLKIWRDYFTNGTIVGLDISPVHLEDDTGRIHVYQGMQQDMQLLDRIAAQRAPDGFDVVIDDCAHIGEFSAISFWHLFEHHLKPGGMYVIEDWGTGYWQKWPDGKRYRINLDPSSFRSRLRPLVERLLARPAVKSRPELFRLVGAAMNHLVRKKFPTHQYGMVGFIKQLVDECAAANISDLEWGTPPFRTSKIHSLQISLGQVVVVKAG